MTWLHDDDTLRYLAEEHGLARQWALFHLLARDLSSVRPTSSLFSPISALLGDGPVDDWGTAALAEREVLPEFVLLARFCGVRPSEPESWRGVEEELEGTYGAAAADLLCVLGQLQPHHLPSLIRRHAASPTLLAWLVSASGDPMALVDDLMPAVDADLQTGGAGVLASFALIGAPGRFGYKNALDAVLAGCTAGGMQRAAVGRGSTKRRAAATVRELSSSLEVRSRALVETVLQSKGELPAVVAYAIGLSASGGTLPVTADHPAGALSLGAEAATDPSRAMALLADPNTRDLGIRVARFAPREDVLARLLELPVPADPHARTDLALALAMMGSRLVDRSLRGVLTHVDARHRPFIEEVYAGLLGQPLG